MMYRLMNYAPLAEFSPLDAISAVRATLADIENQDLHGELWDCGMGFYAAYMNCGLAVSSIEAVHEAGIPPLPDRPNQGWKHEPTMGGIKVISSGHVATNRAILMDRNGVPIKVIAPIEPLE